MLLFAQTDKIELLLNLFLERQDTYITITGQFVWAFAFSCANAISYVGLSCDQRIIVHAQHLDKVLDIYFLSYFLSNYSQYFQPKIWCCPGQYLRPFQVFCFSSCILCLKYSLQKMSKEQILVFILASYSKGNCRGLCLLTEESDVKGSKSIRRMGFESLSVEGKCVYNN